MAGRPLHRLSAPRVAKEVAPGHNTDGGGLYIPVENMPVEMLFDCAKSDAHGPTATHFGPVAGAYSGIAC